MNNCVQALLGVPMGVAGMPNHSDEGLLPTAGQRHRAIKNLREPGSKRASGRGSGSSMVYTG